MSNKEIQNFRKAVWAYYHTHGRHELPWRKTKDPYCILVSEMMLQQTQVPRVIQKYKEFLKRFPTIQALADAPLSEVLGVWSGLGYNRRGKYLHDTAKLLVSEGNFNHAVTRLKLPGVGRYTKSAVRVFAFNEPEVLLETNVRTAIMHHFFRGKRNVEDASLEKVAAIVAKGQDPRRWHSALFDYGTFLKQSGVRLNSRSAGYTKQSTFEGSLRQVRGAIVRELHKAPSSLKTLPFERTKITAALTALVRDGLIKKEKEQWRIG